MAVQVVVQEGDKNKALENPGGDALLKRLGGTGAGLPFFAFLDSKGELIVNSKRPVSGQADGQNIGYPYQPDEVVWFMAMVKKAAPNITDSHTKIIEEWLRNQKK